MSAGRYVALRDLGDWSGGSTPSKAEPRFWTNGTIPWVSPKDMKVEEIVSSEDRITKAALRNGRLPLLPAGSVLVVTRSGILEHTLPVAVTSLPVTINQDLKALVPKSGVTAKYVANAIRAHSQTILSTCAKQGTTVASVDTKQLLNFRIPLVDEKRQRAIVAEIETQFSRADEGEAGLRRVAANLKRYRAATLKAAVEGRLVPTEAALAREEGRDFETGADLLARILAERRAAPAAGRRKAAAAPAAPDPVSLPALAEGWTWATVDQLLITLRNGLSRRPDDEPPGTRILRISSVRPMAVDLSDVRYYRAETGEVVANFELQPDDLLFVRYNGTKELVGVCARVRTVDGAVLHPDKLIRGCLSSPELCLPAFVELAANVGESRRHIDKLIKTTAGQQGIAGSEVKRMPIPLPPLAEQRRIVAEVERRLSIVERLGREVAAGLARAARLRQAVLACAFAGPPSDVSATDAA